MTGARVVALPPIAPEPLAYALARYSRSADPIEESLRWVWNHSSEKFWEKFYFDYGHASIADLGHVALCFENVSELAAIEILDEQSWDGQGKSTRYQDFGSARCVVPSEITEPSLAEAFRNASRQLIERYKQVHDVALKALAARLPRPSGMPEPAYERNLAARAFDMARYLLPLGVPTSLGQVTSIRTLEKQISRLAVSEYAEVRAIAGKIKDALGRAPEPTWNELAGIPPAAAAVAPTLARHAGENAYQRSVRQKSRSLATRFLEGLRPSGGPDVHLIRPHTAEVEMAATLLYSGSSLPYAKVLGRVETMTADERGYIVSEILSARSSHDELPRSARTGNRFIFDISMDVGGWRDLHRHRRMDQIPQPYDLLAGPQFPEGASELGVLGLLEEAYADGFAQFQKMSQDAGPLAAHYLLPFAHRIRCLFKMDFAEVDYVCRLRSGPKGHPSYRKVAWEMAEAVKVAEPALASLIDATPPWIEDPLKR